MKLIIEDDEGRKTVVPIVRDEVEITIGRQEGNTIRLTERNVSRHHAKLTRRLGQVLIEDLNSYNGIKVNGDRIDGSYEVKEGDLVQIGDYDLAIEGNEKAQPRADESAALAETALSSLPESLDAPDLTPTPPLRRPTPAQVARLRSAPPDTPVDPVRGRPDERDHEDEQPAAPRSPETQRRRSSNGAIPASRPAAPSALEVEEIAVEDAPRLILTTSELAGREYACIRSDLTIGRTNDNDIAIDHRSVSQNHCRLVRDGSDWRAFDLHSVSGIKINGEPCEDALLHYGDTLELGHLRFSFLAPGEEPTPAETELSPLEPQASSKVPYLIAIGLVILAALLVAIYFKMHRRSTPVAPASSESVVEAPPAEAAPPAPAAEPAAPPEEDEAKSSPEVGRRAETPPPGRGSFSEGPAKSPAAAGKPEGGSRRTPVAARAQAAKEAASRDFEQAESLKKLGKFKEAVPFFRSAVRGDPDLEVARFDLAVTLAKVGQHAEAALEFQFFADHFPDSPKAEIALTNAREYRLRAPEPVDGPKPDARESNTDRP